MTTPKFAWKPWHQVVEIRADLKSGELPLSIFAADLYDVTMQKGLRPIYEDPAQFFALTYPTYNLRELAKDVVLRLAGKNDKAIRQLELTYGGGKTHTLITLYHLVNLPEKLPDLPAVQEFIQHITIQPPKARVAVLPFDKLDVEKGMEVRAPDGSLRWLRQPWSVLAFQIAGVEGLKLLNAEGLDAERNSAPAENLLVELLALPWKNELATLVLIDEVLMYAREKIGLDPAWRSRLVNFFQYLTQAATKVDHCAVVASLLATDPRMSDELGKQITQELYAVFGREREGTVQPVVKDDVAEVLRRRFFTADSIRDRDAFRPHVVAALKGIADLDEQTRKDVKGAEDRFFRSYPFHPDLTDVFYSKWTGLEGFQRTRGVLRTFALALRDAEKWDDCPLVAANAFLGDLRKTELSESARELTTIAATEEYEGRQQPWSAILQGELQKAREIQTEYPSLRHREIEQAVFATFLHSQPIGQKALSRDLMLLLGHTRPDKIELEKGLHQWSEVSWFLDETAMQEVDPASGGQKALPKQWRLGTRPNLRQMHHDACNRVSPELVESKLVDEIAKLKSLTVGASGAGAKVHNLPERPREIEDDGEFHYAILGAKAASESGKPSTEAKRFLDENTGPEKPRVYRNAVVLAVPSRDGLDALRTRIREHMGWEEVRAQLKEQPIDPIRSETLSANLDSAKKKMPESIQQAYCIVVTVSDKNEAQAFKLTIGADPLFKQIKDDPRSRIQETSISAEAILPGGPYDLWREDEPSRRVKDLAGAFAQRPHLPKMLNRQAILDTLISGGIAGIFVLRLPRPDGSFRTFWKQEPDATALKDPALEVVLPEVATLSEVSSNLLLPGELPDLWKQTVISFGVVQAYFAGNNVVKLKREGYEEPLAIPRAEKSVLETAVQKAVKEGKLWLVSGSASILAEEIPVGILTDDSQLQLPPLPLSPKDIVPSALPDAWAGDTTTALAIAQGLSKQYGKPLPWPTIRDVIDGAFRARWLERTTDSGNWPTDYAGAKAVRLRVPAEAPPPPPPPVPPKPGVFTGAADLKANEIQDLADEIGDLVSAAAGYDLKFHIRIELSGANPPPAAVVGKVNKLLGQVSEGLELQ